jgi:hypothetical protein
MPDWPLICHRCAAPLTPGEGSFYVVRIEAWADPTPPSVSGEETAAEVGLEIEQLLERMKDLSEQELLDQVFRRVTMTLCGACYRSWIENPAG